MKPSTSASKQTMESYLSTRGYNSRSVTVMQENFTIGMYSPTVVFHKGIPYEQRDLDAINAYGYQVLGGVLKK